MISRIHQKLGTAGFIISIVALVAALGGGAYAASGGLTGKQKKEVEKIAKKYAGKPGGNGAPGPAGQAGAKGDSGGVGAEGKQGPEGKQGIEGRQGKEGSPWTAGGVLPAGKTETGTWAFTTPAPQNAVKIPISFSIPLAGPLDGDHVHLVSADGSSEIVINEDTLELEEVMPTACGVAVTPAGTAEAPKAAPGNLCVYFTEITPRPNKNVVTPSETGSNYIMPPGAVCEGLGCLTELGGPGAGAGVSGARLEINSTSTTGTRFGYGSWAVTG